MPSDVAFRELERLLVNNGWTLNRIKGSHHHFRGPNRKPVSLPVHKGKVKCVYARQVQAAIEELRKSGGSNS